MDTRPQARGLGPRERVAGRGADSKPRAVSAALLPATEDALGSYLQQVSRIPLLQKAEQLAQAREIERLEIERWRALLSHKPALGIVGRAVSAECPAASEVLSALLEGDTRGRPRTLEARMRCQCVAARRLRDLGRDQNLLGGVEAAVGEACAQRSSARAYLGRISRARRAHELAKARFVSANLRLVVSMARRYKGSLMPLADLIQEGNLGLLRAVERFDHRRNLRFSTYACWWIRQQINRALSDKARMIRIPTHVLETMSVLGRAAERRATESSEPLAPAQLALQAGVDPRKLDRLELMARPEHPLSLDRPRADAGLLLHELVADTSASDAEQAAERSEQRRLIDEASTALTSLELGVLRLRYGLDGGDGLTLREVGERFGLCRERIRQVEAAALVKLRQALPALDGDHRTHVAA